MELILEHTLGFSINYTDIIFPKTEAILKDRYFQENYFKYLCINKKAILEKYTSHLDFFFCELFTNHSSANYMNHRKKCFDFYIPKKFGCWYTYPVSCKVAGLCSEKEHKKFDKIMSTIAIPVLEDYIHTRGKKYVSWKRFRIEVFHRLEYRKKPRSPLVFM